MPSVSATPPAGNYLFDDEFDGTTVDTAKWYIGNRPGDASNNESGCYIPSNVSEGGGFLTLTAKADSSCSGFKYTAGMVAWNTFNYTHGTLEFRAKFTNGNGTWPAAWMLGHNCQAAWQTTAENVGTCDWPMKGSEEVDISEFKSEGPSVVWQNVVQDNANAFLTCKPNVSDSSKNFHVYSFVWSAGSIEWKIDGQSTCTQSSEIPSAGMFMIFNIAMGGAGGSINNGALPQTMQVDYIRVSK